MVGGNCEMEWSDKKVDDGYSYTAPIGSYPSGASWCGALDMADNVWERADDWYQSDYDNSSSSNPTSPNPGTCKILRGETWFLEQRDVRTANRYCEPPINRTTDMGFRCVIPSEE